MRLMMWRAISHTGSADSSIARHVIGCHLSQETRILGALDDVVSDGWQALSGGSEDEEEKGAVKSKSFF
jgi:hypothetical protein